MLTLSVQFCSSVSDIGLYIRVLFRRFASVTVICLAFRMNKENEKETNVSLIFSFLPWPTVFRNSKLLEPELRFRLH